MTGENVPKRTQLERLLIPSVCIGSSSAAVEFVLNSCMAAGLDWQHSPLPKHGVVSGERGPPRPQGTAQSSAASLRVARTTGCDAVSSIGDLRYREKRVQPQHCRHGEQMGANGGVSPPHPQHCTTPSGAARTTQRLRSNVKVQLHFFAVGTMATFPTWFNYGRLLPWRGGRSQSHAAGQGMQEFSYGLIHPCRLAEHHMHRDDS